MTLLEAPPRRPVSGPSLRDRLLGPRPESTLAGWAAILLVTAVGGLLRFWRLDRPHRLVFDETYYVKQAAAYLQSGYELRWDSAKSASADARFIDGANVFQTDPDRAVHPPVGKWMIAFGEWIFGPGSSWGWRFSAALIGTLSILMVCLIARRLFRSTLLGVVAGALLALDGQHFVHSRTGLLDIFLMFWVLAAFGCLLLDRDQSRRRLVERIEGDASTDGIGPWLGVRWWRLAAAVCLALAIGTKWSGLYFLVAFGLLTLLWDVGARRAAGVRHWWAGGLAHAVPAAIVTPPLMLLTYLATWTGWFRSTDAYNRQWAADHPSASFGWVPDALRSLWYYHQESYRFHVTLQAPHPYSANPWSWLVLGRPTAFDYASPKEGELGCKVADCSQAIVALGNPVIWWTAIIAIAVLLVRWALGRDWRAGAILCGIAAGYLPWFQYQERTIYSFYAVTFAPFVVLGVTYLLGMLLGSARAGPDRRMWGAIAAGAIVLAAALAFWFFLPIWAAHVIPQPAWSDRMWLTSWI